MQLLARSSTASHVSSAASPRSPLFEHAPPRCAWRSYWPVILARWDPGRHLRTGSSCTPNGPLHGTVRAGGAKNSALKLMAACLLCEGRHVLSGVPDITDVAIMAEVLGAIGVKVKRGDRPGGSW